jgi:hypothetical protein
MEQAIILVNVKVVGWNIGKILIAESKKLAYVPGRIATNRRPMAGMFKRMILMIPDGLLFLSANLAIKSKMNTSLKMVSN